MFLCGTVVVVCDSRGAARPATSICCLLSLSVSLLVLFLFCSHLILCHLFGGEGDVFTSGFGGAVAVLGGRKQEGRQAGRPSTFVGGSKGSLLFQE